MASRSAAVILISAANVLLTACAPISTSAPTDSRPSAPKVLTLAISRELESWNDNLVRVTQGGGVQSLQAIGHNHLVVQDDALAWVPQLALEQISVDKGTWRLNPDNTMVTTWRIPPNVKWHDDTPFTAEDLLFTFSMVKDSEVPNTVGKAPQIMQSASAPDATTFVISWAAPYVDADQAPWLTVMPRHLMEETYLTNKAAIPTHPWLTTGFVGLGAYRLTGWERGAYMEFSRFDQYYRGRPPLDKVIVHFMPDDNVKAAAIVSGHLDMIPAFMFNVETAMDVKRRWEGSRNVVGGNITGRFISVEIQHRPEYARPANGLSWSPVRRAFYQAIDRDQLANVMTQGQSPPADSWFFPGHQLRPQVEGSIPQFQYDPRAASVLLTQAGWARGSDGILTNQQTGERFAVQLGALTDDQKLASIIADYWTSIGAQVDEFSIGRLNDVESLATLPGAWTGSQSSSNVYTDRFHSAQVAGPGNRWTGRNRGGYSNPKVDAILDQLVATIRPADRLPLHRELLQQQMGDLADMPLYWQYQPFFVLESVKGVRNGNAWNFFDWDKA